MGAKVTIEKWREVRGGRGGEEREVMLETFGCWCLMHGQD